MATKKPSVKSMYPTAAAQPQQRSIDIRKISNGHIVRESSMGKNGNFQSKETYSQSPPDIQMNAPMTPAPKPAMPKKPASKPMPMPAPKMPKPMPKKGK